MHDDEQDRSAPEGHAVTNRERTLRGAAAIVGVADDVSPTGELERHGRRLEAAMVREALADAGLTMDDVDGLACAQMPAGLAEYLAIRPRYLDGTMVGGSSYELHVEHAAAAISAGLCEVVVGVYAAPPRSDRRRGAPPAFSGGRGLTGPMPGVEFELPYGLRLPMGGYALAASRHMAQYGTTSEQLAQIAVDTRRWAALNPRARYRDEITVDDVLASPWVVTPLHRLDCCLVTDGAGAFVMTSLERARDLPKPPVAVLGAATGGTHAMVTEMPDLPVTGGGGARPAAVGLGGGPPRGRGPPPWVPP